MNDMNDVIEYICHNRFYELTMQGYKKLIRRGDRLFKRGDILYYKDAPICVWRSLAAKCHFAVNHDNHGLERGELTYKLAYAPRGNGPQRFTDQEQNLLRTKYKNLLKPLEDVILFNDRFFELLPSELLQLEQDLKNANKESEAD